MFDEISCECGGTSSYKRPGFEGDILLTDNMMNDVIDEVNARNLEAKSRLSIRDEPLELCVVGKALNILQELPQSEMLG